MGLHGMACYISIVAHVRVVKVSHFFWLRPNAIVHRHRGRSRRHISIVGHFRTVPPRDWRVLWVWQLLLASIGGERVFRGQEATAIVIASARGAAREIKRQRQPDAEGWWEQRAPSLSFNRGRRASLPSVRGARRNRISAGLAKQCSAIATARSIRITAAASRINHPVSEVIIPVETSYPL
jgi:hypothetical protein